MVSGAQAMVACLEAEGVTTVFGYPGAAIAPFYNALAGSRAIRHVLTRTEQGAGHAASGYARMAGCPGVCVATSGPGATNLFTAIATAYGDSIPIIAITGQVATSKLGRDVFQEVDTTGAAEPFTKYAYLVKSAGDIGRVFKEAFHIASTGRKGPVLVDVPADVQRACAEGFQYPGGVNIRGYKPRFHGHALQVKRVAEAICAARRPLLCLGGGLFLSGGRGPAMARELCERASMPAVSTLMGVGALPASHPLFYGMLGNNGGAAANAAVAMSDLLVIIGARVGDRAIREPSELADTAVVHIDIDSAEIGKNVGTTIPLVGDAARVIEQLMERLEAMGRLCAVGPTEATGRLYAAEPKETAEPTEAAEPKGTDGGLVRRGPWQEWLEQLDALRGDERAAYLARPERAGAVDPLRFARALSGMLPEGGIYVADVGQNQIWSARNFHAAAGARFLTAGGMGTMGYSIPAAVGAQLACPGRATLAVCGDGAFQMSMGELATIRQNSLPIKIVVMNNGVLGMVRELQLKEFGRACAVDVTCGPDLSLVAAAYGLDFARALTTGEAVEAARSMLSRPGASLLECKVDPDERSDGAP